MCHATQFIEWVLETGALKFTDHTLHSQTQAPYYFDSTVLCTGETSQILARYIRQIIFRTALEFDVIYGPANKGTPIAITTVMALGGDISWAFNQKTAAGQKIIGAKLKGKRVLIVDNALTTGDTLIEAIKIVGSHGARVCACVVAFDRQEKGTAVECSAAKLILQSCDVPVYSIATLDNLIRVLTTKGASFSEPLERIRNYRIERGAI